MAAPAESEPPEEGKPIGELVSQLVEDGKAYAKAELNVGKAIVEAKVDGVKVPALLGLFAFLFLQAAVVMLGMMLYATVVARLGPFLGGFVVFVILLGVAGGLGWYAAKRIKEIP